MPAAAAKITLATTHLLETSNSVTLLTILRKKKCGMVSAASATTLVPSPRTAITLLTFMMGIIQIATP
jgi:hypothetical protein